MMPWQGAEAAHPWALEMRNCCTLPARCYNCGGVTPCALLSSISIQFPRRENHAATEWGGGEEIPIWCCSQLTWQRGDLVPQRKNLPVSLNERGEGSIWAVQTQMPKMLVCVYVLDGEKWMRTLLLLLFKWLRIHLTMQGVAVPLLVRN